MKRKIKGIEIIGIVKEKANANHDVIVEFADCKKYTATFFTIENIQYLMEYCKNFSGENNNGSFFWASDMIIVKLIDESLIRETIETMIDENYFDSVFKSI